MSRDILSPSIMAIATSKIGSTFASIKNLVVILAQIRPYYSVVPDSR